LIIVNRTVLVRDLRSRARPIALIAYVPALMLPCGRTQGLKISPFFYSACPQAHRPATQRHCTTDRQVYWTFQQLATALLAPACLTGAHWPDQGQADPKDVYLSSVEPAWLNRLHARSSRRPPLPPGIVDPSHLLVVWHSGNRHRG
jgi:hypothetical protein